MKADALFNVTQALRARLQAAVSAIGIPGTVFVGPLDDADASGAPLILFLYRVVPNASLRNRDHVVANPSPPPSALVFRNALPLDLHFLISVGTTPGSSEEALLRALGAAMQSLQLDPEINGPAVDYEAIHVSLEGLTTDEIGRIWALFPTANYRTTVAYIATPVWIDPQAPAALAAPVVQDELHAGGKAVVPTP